MEISIVTDITLIFGVAIGVIYACHRLQVPPIVGFLITGVLIGPGGFGLIDAAHEVEVMAEIGVILLLFAIGLELSIGELIRLKKPVFVGGGAQVAMTGALFFLIGMAFGLPPAKAVFLGCLASLSSTAIVLKLLSERAEIDAPQGRISLSILIFQDLIIVPMMLLAPFLAGKSETGAMGLLLLMAKAVGVIAAVLILAKYVVPRILGAIVRTRIRELFLLTTLGLCLAVAWLTAEAGLSLSLGAFLAGLIISESEFSLSALEGVLPFRDVFTSLFFISVGMLLNTGFFISHLPLVLTIAAGVLVSKAILAGGAAALVGYPLRPCLLVGLAICQVGEFSFILAKHGMGMGLMSVQGYQLFLSSSILTMAATPFIIKASPRLADRAAKVGFLRRIAPIEREEPGAAAVHEAMEDHLVVVGFGIGGRNLVRAARQAEIPYLILEMNPDTVRSAAEKGEPIKYGDATHRAVLEHAGIERARVLAVLVPDPASVRRITAAAKAVNPGLHVIARTRFVSEIEPLRELGARDVVPEEFETSIEIFSRVLREYLVPRGDIEQFAEEIRAEGYGILRGPERKGALGRLAGGFKELEVSGIRVYEGSFMDGLSLEESGLRREHGLTLVAIERDGRVTANPHGDFVLRAGDTAYVFGPHKLVSKKCRLFSNPEAGEC